MKPSHDASRFRLPTGVRPLEYEVALEPDLTEGTFRGEVEIRVEIAKPTSEIVLHAADLEIEAATIRSAGADLAAKTKRIPGDEIVVLRSARRLDGAATVRLAFRGKLGRQLRGFYAVEADGRRYAFTQFEAADARRMFPCFDEPAFKARFRLTVTTAAGDQAVSNGPIESEQIRDGKRVVRFHQTPPLSTYLLALAIGPLEPSAVRMLGATPIRVWHAPGKGHLVEFALEAAAESLARLEAYFAIPYPYGKLDLVAVPDFEAGAMENAGAVFFRETLLLLDPDTVSLPERKRAAEVIAHELAHMWYGDLVTMAWWDDLWLNEAFATWMAYRVVDEWRPEWRLWHGFEHDRAGALALDALTNTHPIYAPVRSVAEATENFDLITYEKGAAVVRMIEHYLGADAFREGVRIYMRRHRERNAVARDLWRALEQASGREVERVAQSWIEQPGFPLLTVRSNGDGKRGAARTGGWTVRQERFFADPAVSPERRRRRWPVPMVVKWGSGNGEPRVERSLVDKSAQPLAGPRGARWHYANASAGGFYRVLHDPANHAELVAQLGSGLTPVERQALAGDQWALVRAGKAPIESFLDVADALGGETDYDVLEGLAASLSVIDDQIVSPNGEAQRRFRGWVGHRFGDQMDALGWQPAREEDDATRLRRAAILRLVGGLAERPSVLEEARRRFDAYLEDRGALEPNLADAVVNLAARTGDVSLYERFEAVVSAARTPQERRRFLLNLASFRDQRAISRTFERVVDGSVPTQDVAFLLMRLFGNPAAKEATWSFFTKRWSALRRKLPPLMVSRLVDAMPSLREPRFARELAAFFRKNPVPEAARAVRQALEVFRLNADLRARTAPGLERWLARSEPERSILGSRSGV